MPTERFATHYNMNHRKRGLALIFNHEHFEIPQLRSRAGTNVDCENLREALEALHFDVSIYKDLKLRDIQKKVDEGWFNSIISMN